jgi:ribosomal protein L24
MVRRLFFQATALLVACSAFLYAQQDSGKTRAVGTVTSVGPHQVTIKDDSGNMLNVDVQDSTRILHAVAGQKSLADAPRLQLSEIHVDDRMLASGVSTNGQTITATTIVVMEATDLAARRSQEQKAWQSGPRGVVTEVNASENKITVKAGTGALTFIRVAPSASVLRYRDGSNKFAEAQPAKLDDIKAGDQLWARGNRSQAGEFVADGMVFGTFVNVAGRVQSVDAATNAVTVSDVFTKKSITLRITPESQMRQLPAPIAQRIAMQVQRAKASEQPSQNGFVARPVDFQQVTSRSPTISIAELHKGDAVIAVAGSQVAHSPAFYLVDGVEPILTASPGGSGAAAFLASWNLSTGGGEGE